MELGEIGHGLQRDVGQRVRCKLAAVAVGRRVHTTAYGVQIDDNSVTGDRRFAVDDSAQSGMATRAPSG